MSKIDTSAGGSNQLDDLAFWLLDNRTEWRIRAIERIELSSHRWSVREREIHVRALSEIKCADLLSFLNSTPLEGECSSNRFAQVILPISQVTKRPVIDFSATVNGQRVCRMLRIDGAKLQARYFRHMMNHAGLNLSNDEFFMLNAIFGSTSMDRNGPSKKHLESELGGDIERSWSAYEKIKEPVANVVHKYMVPRPESPAEHPVLALPYLRRLLVEEGQDGGDHELAWHINSLGDLLDRLKENDQLLEAYATYGWHWEAFAHCTIPVDRPFTITLGTKRHIQFETPTNSGGDLSFRKMIFPVAWSHVRFADAASNHINIRVPDPNVELKSSQCKAKNQLNKDPVKLPDHEYKTDELYAIYSSRSGREKEIWIQSRLRMPRPVGWFHFIVIMTALATLGGVARQFLSVQSLTAQQLAILLTPTTVAASLIMTRDSSHLSAKLELVPRTVIAILLGILWLGVAFLYGNNSVHINEPTRPRKSAGAATLHQGTAEAQIRAIAKSHHLGSVQVS